MLNFILEVRWSFRSSFLVMKEYLVVVDYSDARMTKRKTKPIRINKYFTLSVVKPKEMKLGLHLLSVVILETFLVI